MRRGIDPDRVKAVIDANGKRRIHDYARIRVGHSNSLAR